MGLVVGTVIEMGTIFSFISNTRGVKPVERGGAGKPKTKIKKNKSKGDGKISSHSSEGGRRDQKPAR